MNNLLRGSIPVQISHMKHLKQLSFHGNDLHGSIPKVLPPNIKVFDLFANMLDGKLPEFRTEFRKSLLIVRLDENILTGTINKDIGDLSMLTRLSLFHNLISGTMPESIVSMKKLTFGKLLFFLIHFYLFNFMVNSRSK